MGILGKYCIFYNATELLNNDKRKRIQKRAGRERSSPIFSHLSIRKYSQPFSFIQ